MHSRDKYREILLSRASVVDQRSTRAASSDPDFAVSRSSHQDECSVRSSLL